MSCELQFTCLIPKRTTEDEKLTFEPYLTYKSTKYAKTLTLKVLSWKIIKAKLKRLYNWLTFLWWHIRVRKWRKLSIFVIVIALLLFLKLSVVIPLLFKYFSTFQKRILFHGTLESHDAFDAPIFFDIHGDEFVYKPKNEYITVDDKRNIKLGLWDMISFYEYGYRTIGSSKILTEMPYLLYFHSCSGNRRSFKNVYESLLVNFHIISFDYRGYGDSSRDELSEEVLVNDGIQIYKWLHQNTNASIYVWGNALGAAIATHVVAKLEKENIGVTALILENPFISMSQYLKDAWFIGKLISYTWWYDSTITHALKKNGLCFDTKRYFDKVKCPIFLFNHMREKTNPFDHFINTWRSTFNPRRDHIVMGNENLPSSFTYHENAFNYLRAFVVLANQREKLL